MRETPLRSKRRYLLALVGLLAIGFAAGACGGEPGADVVVQVGDHSLTRAALARWTAIEGRVAADPTGPPPNGLVPDPPHYSSCVAYLRAITPGDNRATAEQLRMECAAKYKLLQAEITRLLITYYWLSGEATARGITVTDREVKQAISRQFPTETAFRKYLTFTGEKPSDEELLIRKVLLAPKLEALKRGLTIGEQAQAQMKFSAQLARKWRPRTSCMPQYVIPECKQYRGPK